MKKLLYTLACGLIALSNATAFAELPTQSTINPATAKALYNPAHNTVAGNPEGSVTLVELFDYNCLYCRELQPIIDLMIERNPDLRVVYKEYILFGDVSLLPTQAALAAQAQDKYLPFHHALLKSTNPLTETEIMKIAKTEHLDINQLKKDMNSKEVIEQIQQSNVLINNLGIQGAPVVIVSGSQIAFDPEKHIHQQQYVRMGFDDAIKDIQNLINQARKENKT